MSPEPDQVVHLHFPVEIEVLSAAGTSAEAAPDPLDLHFPVEIHVVPSAPVPDPEAIADRALALLATSMERTWS